MAARERQRGGGDLVRPRIGHSLGGKSSDRVAVCPLRPHRDLGISSRNIANMPHRSFAAGRTGHDEIQQFTAIADGHRKTPRDLHTCAKTVSSSLPHLAIMPG